MAPAAKKKTGLILPTDADTDQEDTDLSGDEVSDPLELEVVEDEEEGEAALPVASAIARVQQMLDQALKLGQQVGLVIRDSSGGLRLAGDAPLARRRSSDCDCTQCPPWDQHHWWCLVCNSGPHDWQAFKPIYDKTLLNAGGISGIRHALCSNHCAQQYTDQMQQRQDGVVPGLTVDPTLAFPGI